MAVEIKKTFEGWKAIADKIAQGAEKLKIKIKK